MKFKELEEQFGKRTDEEVSILNDLISENKTNLEQLIRNTEVLPKKNSKEIAKLYEENEQRKVLHKQLDEMQQTIEKKLGEIDNEKSQELRNSLLPF